MAQLLLGKEVNAALNQQVREEAAKLREAGVRPTLAIIRIGEREDDISYERGASKRCENLGVEVKKFLLSSEITQQEMMDVIYGVNEDNAVHGILLLRPLPAHLDEKEVTAALDPAKDVDGITDGSLAGVFTGTNQGYAPCTAQACMEILNYYNIELAGKRAAVIGRSLVVGKPVAMMLMQKNATVTVCHTGTADMPSVAREAEILIVAAGRAQMIDHKYLSPGQIVIDVGIHVNEEGKLCGDVKASEAEETVSALTPVPGGVGTVTTSVLVKHVVEAAKKVNR